MKSSVLAESLMRIMSLPFNNVYPRHRIFLDQYGAFLKSKSYGWKSFDKYFYCNTWKLAIM